MHAITWKGKRLRVQSYNVLVGGGGAQLELRRCYADVAGPPVIMVPGFLENADVFFPHRNDSGLAPFLASAGFDVYVAELRGKGKSWPAISHNADWGLHEAVCEDIPAHLTLIEKLRPGVGQFWLGHGLGSLLLVCSFLRLDELAAPVMGMLHVGAARLCRLETWNKTLRHQSWSLAMTTSALLNGYACVPFADPIRRETRASLSAWKQWQATPGWLDPADGFDYGGALKQAELPPSLYLANRQESLWGSASDCRAWIKELGPHDCRLLIIGKAGGNQHNYSYRGLLQHPASCDDHFQQIQQWLEERSRMSTERKPVVLPTA